MERTPSGHPGPPLRANRTGSPRPPRCSRAPCPGWAGRPCASRPAARRRTAVSAATPARPPGRNLMVGDDQKADVATGLVHGAGGLQLALRRTGEIWRRSMMGTYCRVMGDALSDARRVTSASPMARALLCMRNAAARVHAGRRGGESRKRATGSKRLWIRDLASRQRKPDQMVRFEHLVCASGTKSGRPRCAGLKGAAGESAARRAMARGKLQHFISSPAPQHTEARTTESGASLRSLPLAAPQPPRRAMPRRQYAHLNARRQ